MTATLTAVGSGYYRVYVDGTEISQHVAEREAAESAFNAAESNPDAEVKYKHDYEVNVEVSSIVGSDIAHPGTGGGGGDTPDLTDGYSASEWAAVKTLWEANMLSGAAVAATAYNPPGSMIWQDNQYDAAWVMYQIYDYTADSQWLDSAKDAAEFYRDYVAGRTSSVPSYDKLYPRGAREAYERGDFFSGQQVQDMSDQDIFTYDDLTEFHYSTDVGFKEKFSREISYTGEAYIDAEKAGAIRRWENDYSGNPITSLAQRVIYSESHLNQWLTQSYVEPSSGRTAPFMFGLTARFLIRWYYHEIDNGRDPHAQWPTTNFASIPAALEAVCLHFIDQSSFLHTQSPFVPMYKQPYDGSNNYAAFFYEDIGANQTNPSADLNLLISPAFEFAYQAGPSNDSSLRLAADRLFDGAVNEADNYFTNKQFNQNYAWSFAHVDWRDNGISSTKL